MGSKILPFDEAVARRREELYFARIVGISVVRSLGAVQVAVTFADADCAIESTWFFNAVVMARSHGRWKACQVTQLADTDDRSVLLVLGLVTRACDETVFSRVPADAVIVESNGYRALFSRTGRLPLAP